MPPKQVHAKAWRCDEVPGRGSFIYDHETTCTFKARNKFLEPKPTFILPSRSLRYFNLQNNHTWCEISASSRDFPRPLLVIARVASTSTAPCHLPEVSSSFNNQQNSPHRHKLTQNCQRASNSKYSFILAFRALRNTGLALNLGLIAIVAYQGIRAAMANRPDGEDNDAFRTRLDTSGGREVVYCHECDRQWYRDDYGLPCPGCGGEITEIVCLVSSLPPQTVC